MKRGSLLLVLGIMAWACGPNSSDFSSTKKVNPNYQEEAANPAFIHQSMRKLTEVIVHDIFSPPVASRIYVYASIAGYEAALNDFKEYQSLGGQIQDFESPPAPEVGKTYCLPLASVHAFLTVGKALIFSEPTIEEYEQRVYASFDSIGIPADVYERSLAYGKIVADHVLAWADKDKYKETRTFPKYSLSENPAHWQPTPPDYMDGIEPHWKEIRTLVLESPDQFVPEPPTPFDLDKNSLFYQETMEVYTALKSEDKEERLAIAEFWDCNPYVSHHTGHVMYATKKITPGGHWIGITDIVCNQASTNFIETLEAYTLTSIALFDGFISCWDEKYRSILVRPETVINRHIDENWKPALQTPPFPEYTSGHSVISRAAATALTSIFGDNFKFNDTSEEPYGLPARQFNSFFHASDEAAVSRLYGGIHYRPAIDNGVAQGEKVGTYVVENVQLRSQLGME